MKTIVTLAATTVLVLTVSIPAFAQDNLTGVSRLDDRIDDITEAAQDDLDRGEDDERFSPNGVIQGFRGSAALTASGASGNTDTGELSFAGRLSYGLGEWSHLIGFAGEYGEANGIKNEEDFLRSTKAAAISRRRSMPSAPAVSNTTASTPTSVTRSSAAVWAIAS